MMYGDAKAVETIVMETGRMARDQTGSLIGWLTAYALYRDDVDIAKSVEII